MSYIVGVVVGVAGSFLAWLATARVLRPKLSISTQISRVPSPDVDGGFVYRVKVKNERGRQAIDLQFGATFLTQGVHPDRPRNVNAYDIPIDPPAARRLKARGGQVVWLDLSKAHTLGRRLPPQLAKRLGESTVTLEELLNLHGGSSLQFFVRCNDGFSGAPRLAEQRYISGTVGIGLFEAGGLRLAQHRREIDELDRPSGTASA